MTEKALPQATDGYRHFGFKSLISQEDLDRMRNDSEKLKKELVALEQQKKVIEDRATIVRESQQRLQRFLEQLG